MLAQPGWHSSLTKGQTKALDDVHTPCCSNHQQQRPPNEDACTLLKVCPLAERRLELSRTVFQQIVRDESHVLHYLLTPKRDIQLVRRLRSTRTFPTVYARTSHFKNSFILNALNTFQWLLFCQWLLYLLVTLVIQWFQWLSSYIHGMIVVWMCTLIQLMAAKQQ